MPDRYPKVLSPGRTIMIGKTWFVEKKGQPSGSATIFGRLVNPGEPATLNMLLATPGGRVAWTAD